MNLRKSVIGLFLGLTIFAIGSSTLRAAAPTVTIAAPTKGSTVTTNSMTVSGGFNTDKGVRTVNTVICKLNTSNKCDQYMQDASGTFGTKWKALPTTLDSAKGQKSGGYSLAVSGLSDAKYQVAVFAIDTAAQKSARAYASVTVKTTTTPPPTPTGKGYYTIMWGRTNWQATTGTNCEVVSGTRTLEQNAQDMQARGLKGVGGVVVSRTVDTGVDCFAGYTLQPSWEKLDMLRDTYGWTFISQGMRYENMTLMTTDAQRINESLDTLPILKAHGHNDAWGAFNFANNKQDAAAQRIVWQGFAFGRKYGDGINKKTTATSTRIMNTNSINGGKCNNPNLPCYNMRVVNDRRSTSLDVMKKIVNPADNEWNVIQFYRLVEGKRGAIGDGFAWDCSSSDWRDRWTSQPELTCRETFLQVLDSRSKTAQNVTPSQVAQAWGVIPSNRQ